MTYKEISKEFLDKANVTIGDTIKVTKEDISYEGILLDRSEDAKDAYIVIKIPGRSEVHRMKMNPRGS